MKTVLILVLSTEKQWYGRLAETSMATWDSVYVPGVETTFYFAKSESGQPSTDKIHYTDSDDDFWSMGHKTLRAFERALALKQFDYVFRGNASLYINKAKLLNYIQDKPETGLALGVCAPGEHGSLFLWGPGYLLSRGVVQLVVNNRHLWDHTKTDDVAISEVLDKLGIPLDNKGSLCSVALVDGGYAFQCYADGHGGYVWFPNLSTLDIVLPNHFAFRVKDDANRENDVRLMQELHAAFTK